MHVKYLGKNGEHYMGIPDRDLDSDDWARLSAEQRATVHESAFYEVVPDKGDKPVDVDNKSDVLASATAAAASAAVAAAPTPAPEDDSAPKTTGKGGTSSKS